MRVHCRAASTKKRHAKTALLLLLRLVAAHM